jgi:hypothetical protein
MTLQEQLLTRFGAEPIILVELRVPNSYVRVSDKTVTRNALTWTSKILEISAISIEQKVDGVANVASINLTVDDSDLSLKSRMSTERWPFCKAVIYYTFKDTTETTKLFEGKINTPIEWVEDGRKLKLDLNSDFNSQQAGVEISSDDFQGGEGFIPLAFGTILNTCPRKIWENVHTKLVTPFYVNKRFVKVLASDPDIVMNGWAGSAYQTLYGNYVYTEKTSGGVISAYIAVQKQYPTTIEVEDSSQFPSGAIELFAGNYYGRIQGSFSGNTFSVTGFNDLVKTLSTSDVTSTSNATAVDNLYFNFAYVDVADGLEQDYSFTTFIFRTLDIFGNTVDTYIDVVGQAGTIVSLAADPPANWVNIRVITAASLPNIYFYQYQRGFYTPIGDLIYLYTSENAFQEAFGICANEYIGLKVLGHQVVNQQASLRELPSSFYIEDTDFYDNKVIKLRSQISSHNFHNEENKLSIEWRDQFYVSYKAAQIKVIGALLDGAHVKDSTVLSVTATSGYTAGAILKVKGVVSEYTIVSVNSGLGTITISPGLKSTGADGASVYTVEELGTNVADAIKYIAEHYTNLTVDPASWLAVRDLVDKYPVNFVCPSVLDSIQQISEICHQARLAIRIENSTLYMFYASKRPSTNGRLTDDNVLLDSVVLSYSNVADLKTVLTAEYVQDCIDHGNRKITFKNNVDIYDTKKASEKYYIYYHKGLIEKSNKFWLKRYSNIWRKITLKTTLEHYLLSFYDFVAVDLSLITVPALVEQVGKDEYNTELKLWVPYKAGEDTESADAWADDSSDVKPYDLVIVAQPPISVTIYAKNPTKNLRTFRLGTASNDQDANGLVTMSTSEGDIVVANDNPKAKVKAGDKLPVFEDVAGVFKMYPSGHDAPLRVTINGDHGDGTVDIELGSGINMISTTATVYKETDIPITVPQTAFAYKGLDGYFINLTNTGSFYGTVTSAVQQVSGKRYVDVDLTNYTNGQVIKHITGILVDGTDTKVGDIIVADYIGTAWYIKQSGTGTSDPSLKYRIVSIQGDYLTCNPFVDGDYTSEVVNVLKPYKLRQSTTRPSFTYAYTDSQNRTATTGGQSQTQTVVPAYTVGDEVVGLLLDSTAFTVAGDEVLIIDVNTDGRVWARKFP